MSSPAAAATTECKGCGELHPPDDCAWEKQCGECLRSDADMELPRLCVDCAEDNEHAAALQKARDDYEAYGDYLRDAQKDER